MASFPTIDDGNLSEDMISIDGLELGARLLIAAIVERKKNDGDDSTSKRTKTTSSSSIGFVPDTPVDKVVKNDPHQVDRVIERLREELNYWRKSIIPDIGKTGRLETMIKTWMLRIVRAALGVPLDAQWSPDELNYCKIDVLKDRILNRLILLGRKKSSSPMPHPVIVEAVINCSSLHYKIWQTYMKSANKPCGGGSINNRFYLLYRLVGFWDKIINNWYANYHDNVKRDSMLAFVCSGASSMFRHSRIPLCYECNDQCMGIRYPAETVNDQRVIDYVVKLFLELVLSPHIHIEWKLEMSKYLASKGIAMVSQAFGAKEEGSNSDTMTDVRETGPFQPCAARFWDFCKSEKPPHSVEYALITPEPASTPCLSSGAGVFGSINAAYFCPKVADSIPFKALTVLTKLKNPSTRRWIEEGSVLMFNMYPLTVSNSPVGYGRRNITNWKFKSSFVSSIISSIVTSRRRRRNAHDKGSRSSDLLSEGNGTFVKTVLFNCKSELDDVSGNRLFDKTLSFEGDLLGGAITTQQLEKYDTVNVCFPRLSE
uniref:Wsv427-like protein n=1 Tax=Hemigrapsus takanoi nimavirus TaxID=2133792 RepID=A0A401IP37_9VIRU|nr:MAG: wsv427-like protein [Hemigrapsus takanoi nimavirus]GBG35383.1 wsv427-like protein [Hemigrapsus takanoi nimavirus]